MSHDYMLDDSEVSFSNKDGDRADSDMDMTPMVDVTFLLLIFFMVTAAFSLQKSLQIPAPKDNSPSTRAKEETLPAALQSALAEIGVR